MNSKPACCSSSTASSGWVLAFCAEGDAVGEGLVAGPEAFRVQYVRLATQVLLRHWRIHGVSLTVRASLDNCVEVMGPEENTGCSPKGTSSASFLWKDTYRAMLAAMGPRTRRSLAGKRRQLEKSAHVAFLPSLEPAQALEAMLGLQTKITAASNHQVLSCTLRAASRKS